MAKRVSLKGKGADIFFGDYPPGAPAAAPEGSVSPTIDVEPVEAAVTSDLPKQESKKELLHTSMKESVHPRTHARMQERKKEKPAPSVPVASPLGIETLNAIWPLVAERATVTNAFRYTDQELSALTDALYEIAKRHDVKLSKQDIARLGLNAVLWDYRTRGDRSLLGELVARRERQNKGE